MLAWNVIGFIVAGVVLLFGAQRAVRHVADIAKHYRLSEFIVSFIIVGFVSTFPEFFVLVMSAINHVPSLGLGTVLGNNVTDLTLVLGLVALAGGGMIIKAKTIEHDLVYGLLVMLPVVLALDGVVSRIDGFILLGAGGYFIAELVRDARVFRKVFRNGNNGRHPWKHLGLALLNIVVMLAAARGVVWFAEGLAVELKIPAFLIGSVIIAAGAALPELMFALRAVFVRDPQLALGDLMGNIVLDATIVIGIVAIIRPLSVPLGEIGIVGLGTVAASSLALMFIRSGDRVTKVEALGLVGLYVLYVIVQFAGMERLFG